MANARERWRNIGLKTKIIGLLSLILLLLLTVYVAWTYQAQKEKTEEELLVESRVLVTEMDAVWEFISINQNTINYTSDGIYDYKSLHCAIAGKSVAALFSKNSDYSIRFTNLEPRNAFNSPDEFETEALHSFSRESPDNEYYRFTKLDGESVFRYVSAMKVSENCIECHGQPVGEIDVTGYAKEGWESGDIAGAVSVVVPTNLYFKNMQMTVLSDVLFFLAMMVGMAVIIYIVLSRLITNPLARLHASLVQMGTGSFAQLDPHRPVYSSREIEGLFLQFNAMAKSLSTLHTSLESQVTCRTAQLSEANEELERQRHHIEEVNNKLKQDNVYKSDFLAIVSHELRTPLTSILAFCELMGESISPKDQRARKQVEEIDKNSRILLEMVNNILETARIQVGSEHLNLELIDINDLVGMVEASNEPLAAKKDITLTTRVDVHVPLIFCDWEKLRRIFFNLVSNAIKFTPRGGCVQILVSYRDLDTDIEIKVVDNGIGIPKDKHDLIFERFTQENMSTVRRYGGSGLGLSLVKDLVAMLEGTIQVDSELNLGSTFTVVLPAVTSLGDDDDQDNAD
jgi:signal transduction histidine kinase